MDGDEGLLVYNKDLLTRYNPTISVVRYIGRNDLASVEMKLSEWIQKSLDISEKFCNKILELNSGFEEDIHLKGIRKMQSKIRKIQEERLEITK